VIVPVSTAASERGDNDVDTGGSLVFRCDAAQVDGAEKEADN